MDFVSPSLGKVTLREVLLDMMHFVKVDPHASYQVVVGTDSQTNASSTQFVTAIVIRRIGKGAKFYYQRRRTRPIYSLRQRIYTETEWSLNLAMEMQELMAADGLDDTWELEVHIDVGQEGESRKLIQEVVGWVTAVGYTARIKPQAYGASTVADRLSKTQMLG